MCLFAATLQGGDAAAVTQWPARACPCKVAASLLRCSGPRAIAHAELPGAHGTQPTRAAASSRRAATLRKAALTRFCCCAAMTQGPASSTAVATRSAPGGRGKHVAALLIERRRMLPEAAKCAALSRQQPGPADWCMHHAQQNLHSHRQCPVLCATPVGTKRRAPEAAKVGARRGPRRPGAPQRGRPLRRQRHASRARITPPRCRKR